MLKVKHLMHEGTYKYIVYACNYRIGENFRHLFSLVKFFISELFVLC